MQQFQGLFVLLTESSILHMQALCLGHFLTVILTEYGGGARRVTQSEAVPFKEQEKELESTLFQRHEN